MQFLLERLAASPAMLAGQPDAAELRTAVAAQLARIVSARPVETPSGDMTLLQFGMPSIVETALGSAAQLERYAARLTMLIAHYEPRLQHPSVTLEPVQGRLTPYRLVVSGTLAPDGDLHTFRFDLSDH